MGKSRFPLSTIPISPLIHHTFSLYHLSLSSEIVSLLSLSPFSFVILSKIPQILSSITGFQLPAHVGDESSTSFLLIQKIRIGYQAVGTSLAMSSRTMDSTSINHGLSEFRKRLVA
ncbi:unnamed protein product [Eruca vesicaria subsp. sativa]|uniref:Uncharacterized protein n=1 Tax=Eruca vesicaria subsp. sativa TaxID=29727 RepID=A0ABC8JGV5_ERUVS|nr:unnamed protein product [Eruca vesicaria subsp. sativa]